MVVESEMYYSDPNGYQIGTSAGTTIEGHIAYLESIEFIAIYCIAVKWGFIDYFCQLTGSKYNAKFKLHSSVFSLVNPELVPNLNKKIRRQLLNN
jgi:hypothetical protein